MAGPLKIVVDISANGFGHLAQLAPILEVAKKRWPDSSFILRTDLDRSICAEFLRFPFEMGSSPPDPDMRMHGPLLVDADGLYSDYAEIFSDRQNIVGAEAEKLRALSPHLMITNISVMSVAAARNANIPVVALSSLNWADVFETYCHDRYDADAILQWMVDVYSQADLFVLLTPHLPTTWLPNPVSIGSVARSGTNRRNVLHDSLPAKHYVLASMGGIPGIQSELTIPKIDDVVWITPPNWALERHDVLSRQTLDVSFIDLMRSVDAIVTKAGYGSVTESAANGTRILYTEREKWCETPILEAWMDIHCTARKIASETLNSGNFAKDLSDLLASPPRRPVATNGAEEAVAAIAQLI
ncbi:MAG: hypothetical protein VX107_06985 [Pseudomonadota bacterium]|nr:hypothetical protein [Pseudomonadota bacterium]